MLCRNASDRFRFHTTISFALSLVISVVSTLTTLGQGANPLEPVEDEGGLPRVLLIGDSISMGYTIPVRQMLRGQANVHRPPVNCGPTTLGLEQLDTWLGNQKWDLIHFNFGLHDLKHVDGRGELVDVANGQVQVPQDKYRNNLRELIGRLSKTGAKLVWCSTTPVPPGAKGRVSDAAVNYNSIAAEIIGSIGADAIRVNDLHTFVRESPISIQKPADVHFTEEGSRQLAKQVTQIIRQQLQLPPATPAHARGVVFEDRNLDGRLDEGDRRLPGIRVSNGQHIVATNADGQYEIPMVPEGAIFVIKPRGYRTRLNTEKLPQFYYLHRPEGSPITKYAGVSPTGALPKSVDFPLMAQQEPTQFKALLFGDPQPRTQEEVEFIAHDVVEEVIGTDAAFGVTLGDVVFDDLSLFESQARTIAMIGIPWYNVIGNHDLNYDSVNDQFSDESFERVFGPPYYSFDHGPVHFIVLDDVEWYIDQGDGKGKYRGGLGEKQIEYVRRDLEDIPPDQLVVLMMHIPLTDVGDRLALYRLIEKRPFCISIAAHTHRHEHRMIGIEDGWLGAEPHHHIINVTVSGSWWSGARDERNIPHTLMTDGGPNGYSFLIFDGHRYRLDFHAAGRRDDYQMSIFATESTRGSEAEREPVYANVFNALPGARVEMRVDDLPWRPMDRVLEVDPYYIKIQQTEAEILTALEKSGSPRPWTPLNFSQNPSTHLWKLNLPPGLLTGEHQIRIRATEPSGQIYRGRRLIQITP